MGAYNTIEGVARCPSCASSGPVRAQFKYGDVWQHHYGLGDTLRWGGNDRGVRGARLVVVDAVAETRCSHCGYQGDWDLYLRVEDDVLAALETADGRYEFAQAIEPFIVVES